MEIVVKGNKAVVIRMSRSKDTMYCITITVSNSELNTKICLETRFQVLSFITQKNGNDVRK